MVRCNNANKDLVNRLLDETDKAWIPERWKGVLDSDGNRHYIDMSSTDQPGAGGAAPCPTSPTLPHCPTSPTSPPREPDSAEMMSQPLDGSPVEMPLPTASTVGSDRDMQLDEQESTPTEFPTVSEVPTEIPTEMPTEPQVGVGDS